MTTPELQAAVDELLIALADNLNERVGKSLNTILTALSAAQKDRDCWLFNAQELQKQVNKMEKQIVELRDKLKGDK